MSSAALGNTPPPNAAATPPVAPQFQEESVPPLQDAEHMAELVSSIVEATACSLLSAERALLRCKNNIEAAADEILSKRGFTLILISFCQAQEVYFTEIFRSLHMKSFFSDMQAEDLMQQSHVVPYYIRYDEYAPYARSKDWAAFYQDMIVDGEFPLVPHDAAGRAQCQGGIVGVVTATDSACPLVDYLNERLIGDCRIHPSFGNPFSSIEKRQCKSAMHDALHAAGLAYIRSMKVRSFEEGMDFANNLLNTGSLVIVKPATGAGSEFVTLCSSLQEVQVAFALAAGLETTQQTTTEWMVVQEYIDGEEYVVDTVSCHSAHIATDVWVSKKVPYVCVSNRIRSSVEKELAREGIVRPVVSSTSLLYDRLDFVSHATLQETASEERRVVEYTLAALDALELVNGCSHCEVRVKTDQRTGEKVPVLIELNPRMQGDTPRSTNLVGYDQYIVLAYMAKMYMRALRSPGEKISPWAQVLSSGFAPLYPSLADRTRCVLFLRVREDGYICEVGRRYITRLPTFVTFTRSTISEPVAAGFIGRARKTTDLYSCPAALILEGSIEAIEADVATIRLMENDRLSNTPQTRRAIQVSNAAVQRWRKITKRRDIIDAQQKKLMAAEDVCSDEELSFNQDEAEFPSPIREQWQMRDYLESESDERLTDFVQTLERAALEAFMNVAQTFAEHTRVRAAVSIREAKAAISAMDPPPLFLTNAEWADVTGCHCGGILGS